MACAEKLRTLWSHPNSAAGAMHLSKKCFHSGQGESMFKHRVIPSEARDPLRQCERSHAKARGLPRATRDDIDRNHSAIQVEVLALGFATVLSPKPPAALQFGHDQIDELLDRAGAVDRRQHEAVAADEVEIRFELVGDV
jgi:hypothetical protein